jgi:hypothetical protein
MCDVRARVISCVEEGVVNGAPAVDALLCEQLLKDGKVHRVRVEERAVEGNSTPLILPAGLYLQSR